MRMLIVIPIFTIRNFFSSNYISISSVSLMVTEQLILQTVKQVSQTNTFFGNLKTRLSAQRFIVNFPGYLKKGFKSRKEESYSFTLRHAFQKKFSQGKGLKESRAMIFKSC